MCADHVFGIRSDVAGVDAAAQPAQRSSLEGTAQSRAVVLVAEDDRRPRTWSGCHREPFCRKLIELDASDQVSAINSSSRSAFRGFFLDFDQVSATSRGRAHVSAVTSPAFCSPLLRAPSLRSGAAAGQPRRSCLIRRPCCESSIRVASRRALVASLFALMTHQVAGFRYESGCAWKNAHAFLFARNSRSWARVNAALPARTSTAGCALRRELRTRGGRQAASVPRRSVPWPERC